MLWTTHKVIVKKCPMDRAEPLACFRLQPTSPEPSRIVRSDAAAIRASVMATTLAQDIAAPAAIVNESWQVVFANDSFLRMAGAEGVDDVLGARLRKEADALGSRFSDGNGFDDPQPGFAIRSVPLRLRDRTFSLVQLVLRADDAAIGA